MTEEQTTFSQRYVLTIKEGEQHLYPIPQDAMIVTADKLPSMVGMFLPEYSLRKRSEIEIFLRGLYFKYYSNPKFKRNYKRFLKKVRAANIKNNPHYVFKKYE